MRKPRKSYTPAENVAILWRHLIERGPNYDLCDKYQLSPTLFYPWQKLFFGIRPGFPGGRATPVLPRRPARPESMGGNAASARVRIGRRDRFPAVWRGE
jgi:hypothetical protein